MSMWKKGKQHNELGVLRPYDFVRPTVKLSYGVLSAVLVIALLVCLMPFVWVLLSGFKDQREFIRGVRTLLPDGNTRYFPHFLLQVIFLNICTCGRQLLRCNTVLMKLCININ